MNDSSTYKAESLIYREIDGSYIVWFANGNQYVRLEEPAFFVLQNLESGINAETIARQCSQRYQSTKEESTRFVSEISSGIEAIRKQAVLTFSTISGSQELREFQFVPFSTHPYSINGKWICFRFETKLYEYYLHPLLQHLETETPKTESILFELFEYNNQIVLRCNQHIKGIWKKEETHLLKGMVFLQILNAAYEKNDNDWMAIIHASAVTNGEKTIVFTASPGSGKSTIAALLMQKGYALVSDDFVPIERFSRQVFPFPAAMSVKEGANELLSALYPELLKQSALLKSTTNKMVKYLPIEGKALPGKIKETIFIKYDPAIDFEWELVPRADALKMLLDETWTAPSAVNASCFLDWYCGISCYRLTYSNNEKALEFIAKLFEQ